MIYLDNGATSHPKPEAVYTAADQALRAGGNPGRGGHRLALAAGRRVLAAREAVAELFGLEDSARVLFTTSATDSLNLALKGVLRPGDHVVTTNAEHNALRRPLAVLERQGVEVTWVSVGPDGVLNPDAIMLAVKRNTRMIAVSHGSNVTGAVQDLAALGKIARRSHVLLLVDAAQTAGVWPINVKELGIHLLAAPGHKGLLGPQGTGILLVDPTVELQPIREGGTGSHSADLVQPAIFPEGFESGTLNVAGIAGLEAGVRFLLAEGVDKVQRHEQALATVLSIHLRRIPGVTVYGPTRADLRCGVVCFNIKGMDCSEVEERLDDDFGVIGRAGLHCNPGAHEVVGSFALGGAMRLSPGYFNTMADIDAAVQAVTELAKSAREGE